MREERGERKEGSEPKSRSTCSKHQTKSVVLRARVCVLEKERDGTSAALSLARHACEHAQNHTPATPKRLKKTAQSGNRKLAAPSTQIGPAAVFATPDVVLAKAQSRQPASTVSVPFPVPCSLPAPLPRARLRQPFSATCSTCTATVSVALLPPRHQNINNAVSDVSTTRVVTSHVSSSTRLALAQRKQDQPAPWTRF